MGGVYEYGSVARMEMGMRTRMRIWCCTVQGGGEGVNAC